MNIIRSAKSFKNHAIFILNINTRIMHYKPRSSQESCITNQDPVMIILARFWSGHHGQILPGSMTSDLSEPYGNLGKILVRSLAKSYL